MTEAPAEAIEDFEHLSMTQTRFNTYAVTNHSSGTAYEVGMAPPECECEDFEMGESSEDHQACKHLLYVGFQAYRNTDTSEHILRFLSNEAHAVEQAAQSIEQTATSMEAFQQGDGTAAGAGGENGSAGSGQDPVEKVTAWLEDEGVPVGDGVDVYEHSKFGSVNIEKEGRLSDDEFGALRDATDEDFVQYHQAENLNYIKQDDLGEVPSV